MLQIEDRIDPLRAQLPSFSVDWRFRPRYAIQGNLAGSRLAGSRLARNIPFQSHPPTITHLIAPDRIRSLS